MIFETPSGEAPTPAPTGKMPDFERDLRRHGAYLLMCPSLIYSEEETDALVAWLNVRAPRKTWSRRGAGVHGEPKPEEALRIARNPGLDAYVAEVVVPRVRGLEL